MCLVGNGAANLCHSQVTILYDEQKADDFLCLFLLCWGTASRPTPETSECVSKFCISSIRTGLSSDNLYLTTTNIRTVYQHNFHTLYEGVLIDDHTHLSNF
jgi:hypothetical protein